MTAPVERFWKRWPAASRRFHIVSAPRRRPLSPARRGCWSRKGKSPLWVGRSPMCCVHRKERSNGDKPEGRGFLSFTDPPSAPTLWKNSSGRSCSCPARESGGCCFGAERIVAMHVLEPDQRIDFRTSGRNVPAGRFHCPASTQLRGNSVRLVEIPGSLRLQLIVGEEPRFGFSGGVNREAPQRIHIQRGARPRLG